jgi:hypothetical protein
LEHHSVIGFMDLCSGHEGTGSRPGPDGSPHTAQKVIARRYGESIFNPLAAGNLAEQGSIFEKSIRLTNVELWSGELG